MAMSIGCSEHYWNTKDCPRCRKLKEEAKMTKTVQQLKLGKLALELEIKHRLEEFSEEFEVSVIGIDLEHRQVLGMQNGEIESVHIFIKI